MEKPNLESLPEELSKIILDYANKTCYVCLKRMNKKNAINFFEFPRNNKHSKTYCSITCYNHI